MKIIVLILMFLFVGCGGSDAKGNDENISQLLSKDEQQASSKRIYGKSLDADTVIQDYGNAVLYRPKILDENHKIPIVLFVPGWNSQEHHLYKTILSFIASQGYAALYAKDPSAYDPKRIISRYSDVLDNKTILKYIDTSRIGVMGHSSGGGLAFMIMKHFSDKGFGENGRFIFAMDPWFAFGMSKSDFKNFPKNIRVVIQQFGDSGGTDPRIALTIFDKLEELGDTHRDYQVYKNLNHKYPFSNDTNYDQRQVILKPLDALMDLVFSDKQKAYTYSLELGNDKPYGTIQEVKPSTTYPWKCYGENPNLSNALAAKDIDYCKIVP